MSDFSLVLPEDFDDFVAWEVEAKGWFNQALMTASGKQYRLMFYDAVRLAQTIEDDLRSGGVFFEPNLVVVPTVTKAEMERTVRMLVETNQIASLVAE